MISPMFPVPADAQSRGASDVAWFAGLAMQSMIQQQGIPETEAAREELALWAFRMGQAMSQMGQRLHESGGDQL